ncbi:MAG: hypothetical protein JEZ00_18605 [Anaerolineaceae bacterium]|nr:hypothetical protein [Anaerolineaceae bacterium]
MSLTICFHHDDADGRASGAVVRYALGKETHLIEIDYDDLTIPWELVEKADKVVVVDFSFDLDTMKKLAEGREFTWIDHHISAIKEFKGISDNWPGLRDIEEAACVLAWKYFFPDRPVPRAIVLIGDRDVWRWAEKDTGAFGEGIYVRDTRSKKDALWVPLLEEDQNVFNEILIEGTRLREIRINEVNSLVERRGYEITFYGERTLAINAPGNGDIGQRSRDLGYEIAYCYEDRMEPDGLYTNVTLFSREKDISVIAKSFGGGGHAHAAGFSFPRSGSPFPPGADVQFLHEKHQ